jgi:hypothetical protein
VVAGITPTNVGKTVTLVLSGYEVGYDDRVHVTGQGNGTSHNASFSVGIDSVAGDDTWIAAAVNPNDASQYIVRHTGPGSATQELDPIASLMAFKNGNTVTLTMNGQKIASDGRGHVIGLGGSAQHQVSFDVGGEVTGDEVWIHAETVNNTSVVSHIGPSAATEEIDSITSISASKSNNTVTLTVNGQKIGKDAKGHVTGAGTSAQHQTSFDVGGNVTGDETWIHAAGNQISHIGPGAYADFFDPSISLSVNGDDEIEISYFKGKFDAKGHFCSQGEQTTETASLGLVKITVVTACK